MPTIKPWVMGNWKMNPTLAEYRALVSELAAQQFAQYTCGVVVFPTALHTLHAAETLQGTGVAIGAQLVSTQQHTGAFTGEVSAQLYKEVGITWAMVGHSERRHLLAETAEQRTQQITAALAAEQNIVLCVGETLTEREAGQAMTVVAQQLHEQKAFITPEYTGRIVIAYEPVWAIGTGKTASGADASEMHQFIRTTLKTLCTPFAHTAILYGGSVKSDNVASFATAPDVNGVLVGGASLNTSSFMHIVAAFSTH